MPLVRLIVALFVIVTGTAPALAAEKRVALVIGNSTYENVSNLKNPANDAADLAAAFGRIGFDVTVGVDMDYRKMRLALRDFAETANDADVVVIYFAGHGVEIENTNYLIPVNAELKRDRDVEFEAIRLDAVVNAISGTDGLKIILVDACRNNPFLSDMVVSSSTRSIGRGLGRIDPAGVVVGYAARGGTLALDGDDRNSPYAQALLKHIEEPGLELGKMFRKVRDSVFDATGGYQEPFTYGSLPGEDIFLIPPKAETETRLAAMAPVPLDSSILTDFATADTRNNVYSWNKFLEKYQDQPDHELVKLAAAKREAYIRETEINTRRLNREPWLKAEFPNGQREAVLSQEQRKLVQEALLYLGQDVGTIDGDFGPKTRRAIAAARLAAGLGPGQMVDIPLLRALPNVPEMKKLQTGTAVVLKRDDFPDALEPRLAKVHQELGTFPMLWGYFGGHLYVAVHSTTFGDWNVAHQNAKRAGGYLATINSAEENRFLYDLFMQDSRFTHKDAKGAWYGPMIGLYQVDRSNEPRGGWTWANGDSLSYNNFSPGNPDNFGGGQHYGRFFRSSGQRGGPSGPYWWDDTQGNLWCCGYIIEVE
jgi:hypothetical protein